VVHLSRTPREIMKAIYEERGNLSYASLAVVTLLIIISLLTSFKIIGPVKTLAIDAREVSEGKRGSLSHKRKGLWEVMELSELRDSVTLMSERLNKRSDYLKTFASGVSHEFKTPLSSIRGALELITEHGSVMSPEVLRKFQDNIKDDLDRLDRLLHRLLSLARAEAISPAGEGKTDLTELLHNLSQRLTRPEEGFQVTIETGERGGNKGGGPGEGEQAKEIPGDEEEDRESESDKEQAKESPGGATGAQGALRASGPPEALRAGASPPPRKSLILNVEHDALETALINLIENSRESGAKNSRILAYPEGHTLVMEISDDGPGISLDDPEKIFAPFYTTRKKEGGTGLGLPLARTLLAGYQGELRFLRRPSTFEIRLPMAKG
jgi:signal transduction histidine kinase